MGKIKNYADKHLGIIVISLVPEARTKSHREIEKQIRNDYFIPFCAKIEEIAIGKV